MSGKRTKCDRCNAGRGLAEYPDGIYCYACHFKEKRKNLYSSEEERLLTSQLLAFHNHIITPKWLNWLMKYYITLQDIKDWSMGILMREDALSIKFNDGCQWIRHDHEPKWRYNGDKKLKQCYLSNDFSDVLCIVEDPISAIRIRHHVNSLLLSGTYLNVKEHSNKLNQYSKIVLWLDGDEAGQRAAMRIRKELKLKHEVVNICTSKDPKCYTDGEIKRILIQNNVKL